MKKFPTIMLALALLPSPAFALGGACTAQLDKLQQQVDSQVGAAAASGPTGPESTDAKLHHQPTPQSLAQAEANLGDKTAGSDDSFIYAMKRARDADDDNQEAKCLAALADAKAAVKK
jgi:hypothetical protein